VAKSKRLAYGSERKSSARRREKKQKRREQSGAILKHPKKKTALGGTGFGVKTRFQEGIKTKREEPAPWRKE